MRNLSAVLVITVYAFFPDTVFATGMMEPPRKEMLLSFDNGDSLQVLCQTSNPCLVNIQVQGKLFTFTRSDFNGLEPYPGVASLYSGSFSGGSSYFSFEVEVNCPESDKNDGHTCHASALVDNGTLKPVHIMRIANKYLKESEYQ